MTFKFKTLETTREAKHKAAGDAIRARAVIAQHALARWQEKGNTLMVQQCSRKIRSYEIMWQGAERGEEIDEQWAWVQAGNGTN
jgi:hypothetical protein